MHITNGFQVSRPERADIPLNVLDPECAPATRAYHDCPLTQGSLRTLRVLLVKGPAWLDGRLEKPCASKSRKMVTIVLTVAVLMLYGLANTVWGSIVPPRFPRSATLHSTIKRAELGPKSQHRGSRHVSLLVVALLICNQLTLAEGVGTGPGKPRVVIGPATMTGVPVECQSNVITEGAKTSGEGPQRQRMAVRKIAFRRATARAQRTGLAQYRGRTLRAEPHAGTNDHPAAPNVPRRLHHPPRLRTQSGRIQVMTYNAGGLSTHHYTELLAWLHILKGRRQCPDVVMVQETHWSEDHDYSNDMWRVISSGCNSRHSGLLIMLAKATFATATIRKEIAVAGRVLAARVQQGQKVLHLINVYQKVWNGTQEAKQTRAQVLESLMHCRNRSSKLLAAIHLL